MDRIVKIAEVVGNGRGQLFAQVAENREYTCWALTDADISRFNLREHDEIDIEVSDADQSCRVVGHHEWS